MQISVAPPAISAAFFDAIRRLKDLNFLWKWDGELPKDLPSNIFMRTWMPQQDILGWSSLIVFQMPYQIFLKLIKCITFFVLHIHTQYQTRRTAVLLFAFR